MYPLRHRRPRFVNSTWLITGLLLLGWMLPLAAAPYIPPDYTAQYRAQRMGMAVVGEISLRRDGERLHYQADLRPAGMLARVRDDEITERTTIRITPHGLRSESYLYHHRSSRRDRLTEAHFDWQNHQVNGTHRGRPFHLPLQDGMVDRFALQIALINDIISQQRQISRTLVDRNRIVTYDFTLAGARSIRTALGELEAIEVQRYNKQRDMTVSIWFAPDLHYIPVRVEQIENGERVVLDIQAIQWHSTTTTP